MRKALSLLAALALAGAANAGVLYDNGAPNYQNGNEMTQWTQAEDFVLGNTGGIASVNFSVLDTTNGGLSNWDGTVGWWIYPDAGNVPGNTPLASGAGNNINASFDSNQNGWDFYNFSFDLNPDGSSGFTATGGVRYWLALHLNTTRNWSNRDELYWASTDPNGTPTGHELNGNQLPWGNNGTEHSFSLKGEIPAPGALALLGLAGLTARRRRRG